MLNLISLRAKLVYTLANSSLKLMMIFVFLMIGMSFGNRIDFLNLFSVYTSENSTLSYDSVGGFAIITKPNISYAFSCENDGRLRYCVKSNDGCFHGIASCEDLPIIIDSYDEFKVIKDGVPDDADFMYNIPCKINGDWFVGNCSYYGRNKDPDVYREIWVVMDLDDGYFPGVYYHFGKKTNVIILYDLLRRVGPTNSDIENWIKKNCGN